VAIVIGCGPIGLCVISALKARGVRTVVASDFSRRRRELASACGADVVVDPGQDSPYEAAGDRGHLKTVPEAIELAHGTTTKLRRLPLPWHHVWRVAEKLGAKLPAENATGKLTRSVRRSVTARPPRAPQSVPGAVVWVGGLAFEAERNTACSFPRRREQWT
jgi:threonine dehydrogenase-like Zn-dependent dehydrogenase